MFATAASPTRKRAATVHEFLKSILWRSKLPAARLLDGKFTLTAANLIGTSPTEPHVLRWIEELLRPGDTFFDVGAHYGWMSLVACHRVGASGKVVAFEPSPPLVELLRYHRKLNRFRQMEILQKAVADSDSKLVPFFLLNGGDSFLNSLIDHPVDASGNWAGQKEVLHVETVALDEFCRIRNLHPHAVKIDVEGGELFAVRGCMGLLKKCQTTFIVAVHPAWLPKGQSAEELFDLFREHGYKVAGSQCVQYEGADFGDYLFVPGDQA